MVRTRLTIDDILKLKAVALYVIDKCQVIDYFHLFKILYFADREHYAVYGRRIIKDTFCALQNGPVPSFLYDAVKALWGGGNNELLQIIATALEIPDVDYKYYIKAVEKPDMDELSDSDKEMLNKSISENQTLPFDILSRKSHDIAWQDAWNRQHNSNINPELMARAAGASEATLEYIRENYFFDELIKA